MYETTLREAVSQGDIFSAAPFTQGEQVCVAAVMVLNHDCSYDKVLLEYPVVAAVRHISALAPGAQGDARAGRIASVAYLPPIDGFPESFVDFNCITNISKAELERLSATGQRLRSLTDDGQFYLQERLVLFFTRRRLPPPE